MKTQNLLKIAFLFTILLTCNSALFAQNNPFTGTWNSNFGNLMLVQVGSQVAGDYSTFGTIEGTYNPTTRQLTGTFDNQSSNIKGRLIFTLNTAGTAFTGKWGRDAQPLTGTWNATQTSSAVPTLKIAKAPAPNYGELQTGNWTNPFNKGTVITVEKGKDYTVKNTFPTTGNNGSGNNTNNANAAYIPPKTPTKTVKVPTEDGKQVDVKTTLDKKSSSNQASEINEQLTDIPYTQKDNCVTKTLNFSAEKTDLSAFMANSTIDWLLPGNLFYSTSIVDGSYQVPNYARKSINLTASIYGNGLKNSFTVQNPKISTINQTMNNFIAANNALPHGATLRKEEKQVHTKTDLSVAVFGKYDGKVNGVKAQLNVNFAQNKAKSYHLIDFTQGLFEVAVDNIDAKNHFNAHVSPDEISKMAYISSVVYGRRAIMVCETELSNTDFNTAFQAAYSNAVMDASGKVKAQFKKFFDKTNLYMLIYGGSETAGLKAISLSPKEAARGFRDFINTSFAQSGRSTAKPISYKYKFLADNSTCMVKTVFNQPVRKCTPIEDAYDLRIKITKVDCVKSDDSDRMDDYRLTATANFKVNNKRQNFKTIHFEGQHKQFQKWTSHKVDNRLMYFDEKHQLHVHESQDQPIGSYGTYALPDLTNANNRMELALQLWMCERSGDGCDGMVAKGGNVYPINLQEVLNLLTGVTSPNDYQKDPSRENMLKLGSDYAQMHAIVSPVNGSQKVMKLSSWMYARNKDYSRKARIHYEIELVKRVSSKP